MNIRMTLTAVALAMMTLAGCSSMSNDKMIAPKASKDTMVKEGTVMAKDAMVKEGTVMAKDEMTVEGDAATTSTNAAFDACFAGGGQVVNFIGDLSGETMACEGDGVQTII